MQLISIETTNFKKLRHFKATFAEGLNVIVGDNAQGKSTLLQAIEAALYGATVVPGKKDAIPTWGQSTWKIELLFALNGEDYRVTRSKTTAKLERFIEGGTDADLVANGNTPVTAAIEELLDLNAKDFNLFMQSKQGETSGVLTFGAAALNRKVEQFAGISLIDRVQGLAQEELRTRKAEADTLAVPAEEMESAEQQVDGYADVAIDAEKALHDARAAFDELPELGAEPAPVADPDAMQEHLNLVTKLQGKKERAEQEVKHAKQRHQEALQRFEELDKPEASEALEERVKALSKWVRDAVAEVTALQKELDLQERLWADLEKAEKAMDGHLPEDDIGEALSQAVERQAARHDERRLAQHRVVELNQQIKQLQSLRDDAHCPTCGTKLTEHDPEKLAAEIEQLVEQRKQHERNWKTLTTTCQAIDKQVTDLEKDLESRKAAEVKVDDLRETLAGKGVDLQTAESPVEGQTNTAIEVQEGLIIEKANLENRLERNEGQWRQYRRAEKAVATEKEYLDELTEELEEVERQLVDAGAEGVPTEEDIKRARWELSEYETRRNALRSKRLEAQHVVDMADNTFLQAVEKVDHAKKTLDNLRQQQVKSSQAAKEADQAARLSRFLRERRAGYLQEVWDAVLAAASRQVFMASKGLISRLVYDEGDFLYEEEGVLAPVASASGAQKAHIGVAIRIGLSRALYGNNALIIFDEPTESMSEHNAGGLSASLAGAAAQCLLITHRTQDQDLANNVIEVAA